MFRTLFSMLLMSAPLTVAAQSLDLPLSEFGILNNSIANLEVDGGTVWVGPFLNASDDGGETWYRPATDSLFGTVNRLFSLDIEGDIILAGIGRNDASGGQSVQTASGFLVSQDGGRTFAWRFPQLDDPGDNTQEYGVNILEALPVIVPQQSPPFDVDVDAATGTMWVAGWASGIRRSEDQGRTWSRVVLPPDDLDFVSPDSVYDFVLEPQRGSTGSLNHMGFSVLTASDGTVWAGTAGGLNRSLDGGLTWRRFTSDGTQSSLTGNWVISIEEQSTPASSIIWAATWNTGDVGGGNGGQFGVSLTRDGGQSFEQTLLGQRIYDVGFAPGRVYAAGDNGLFISTDEGRTWRTQSDFRDRANPGRLVRPGSAVFSVETSQDGTLWAGTSDGLLRSLDDGLTWSIFRTDVPVRPDMPTPRTPRVDTYAYPNPFSPGSDRFIRIKFEAERPGDTTIRIFDFGMNDIRTLNASTVTGTNEILWDGTDHRGARVANGTYFYEIGTEDTPFRGKILVIE
jgi:photosystem II stability/assembly factor-like uncharacterized protein